MPPAGHQLIAKPFKKSPVSLAPKPSVMLLLMNKVVFKGLLAQ
jgi:hypothetical protein